MALLSPTLHMNAAGWRHLLRATLRECTYLPDPIARVYMRDYVLSRYRRALDGNQPVYKSVRRARYQLYHLQRANEGYLQPLQKVLMMSYGRIGHRRHHLLAPLTDRDSQELLKQGILKYPQGPPKPQDFGDDWELPLVLKALIRAQINSGVIMASKLRPPVKGVEPPIPETNSWNLPMPHVRKVNMRRRFNRRALDNVLPPLPEQDLATLEGLLSGAVSWSPKPRRSKIPFSESKESSDDSNIVDFLVNGPQKGHTFGTYVDGRPHVITYRLMSRLWRRVSCHVPRMTWREQWSGWEIIWDTPKILSQVAFDVQQHADLSDMFGEPAGVGRSAKSQQIES